MKFMQKTGVLFLLLSLIVLPTLTRVFAQDEPTPRTGTGEAKLLSAYFGLDNALPFAANAWCLGAANQDGMPVIFSLPVDDTTLDPEDFAIITASGAIHTPRCVTLKPADEPGEQHTALLIGDLGDAVNDPPQRVQIVGQILALNAETGPEARETLDFKGAEAAVTPLDAGPFLVMAESVPASEWKLDQTGKQSNGSGCPSQATVQVVRVKWAGGVTKADGSEADDLERAQYRVTLVNAQGEPTTVTPFALADLDDGDNNHLLCLDMPGTPISVFFPAGSLYDPNHDAPNPDTTVTVMSGTAANLPGSFRNVRYCEVIPAYRKGLTLRAEVWNTLGLNDCPADQWKALDAVTLQQELGAISVRLNGPRYWVLDEIAAEGGVTSSGDLASFGSIEMQLRAVLDLPLTAALRETRLYSPNTIQRDTRYVFHAGLPVYELIAPDGNSYVMQSYSQIIDPTLMIDDLAGLGARLTLPEGWEYRVVTPEQDLVLTSEGETTVIQDDFLNTYQQVKPSR